MRTRPLGRTVRLASLREKKPDPSEPGARATGFRLTPSLTLRAPTDLSGPAAPPFPSSGIDQTTTDFGLVRYLAATRWTSAAVTALSLSRYVFRYSTSWIVTVRATRSARLW